jgi:hypothetical protein
MYCPRVVLGLAVLVRLYGPPGAYGRHAIPRPRDRYRKSKTAWSLSLSSAKALRGEGGPKAALEETFARSSLLRQQGDKARDALFDDFHDAKAARFHNHRPIVHDRIPVARPYMVLAR